jgi:hypothetical protein
LGHAEKLQLDSLPNLSGQPHTELVTPPPQGAQLDGDGIDALVLTGDLLHQGADLPDEGLRSSGEDTDPCRSEQGADYELNGLGLFGGHGINGARGCSR